MNGLASLVPLTGMLASTSSRQRATLLTADLMRSSITALLRRHDDLHYATHDHLVAALPPTSTSASSSETGPPNCSSSGACSGPAPSPHRRRRGNRASYSRQEGTAPVADVKRLGGLVLDVLDII